MPTNISRYMACTCLFWTNQLTSLQPIAADSSAELSDETVPQNNIDDPPVEGDNSTTSKKPPAETDDTTSSNNPPNEGVNSTIPPTDSEAEQTSSSVPAEHQDIVDDSASQAGGQVTQNGDNKGGDDGPNMEEQDRPLQRSKGLLIMIPMINTLTSLSLSLSPPSLSPSLSLSLSLSLSPPPPPPLSLSPSLSLPPPPLSLSLSLSPAIKFRIDRRSTLADLKKELEAYIKLPSSEFKVHVYKHTHTPSHTHTHTHTCSGVSHVQQQSGV